MNNAQQYRLKPALPKIQRHDQLPQSAREIGRCLDTTEPTPGYEQLYTFVKREQYLSLLVSYTPPLKRGPQYFCDQFDFSLKVLSWFPKALEDFRRPPADGLLHAGGMISRDYDVDGEMLAVSSTTDGYDLRIL